MSVQQEKFKAIADKIREKTGTTEPIVPNDFANKIDDVYSAGKEAYLDEMWEEIQQGGERENYVYCFGNSWIKDTFKPKYDFVPTNANGMFYFFNFKNTDKENYVNLKELLIERNVKLDTSKNTNFAGFMGYARFFEIPTIDFSSVSLVGTCFTNAYIVNIEKIVVRKELKYSNTSFQMVLLENIEIEGEIGNDINFQWSTLLTKKSIISIITALSETTGATLTLSQTAVNAVDWNGTVIDSVTYNTWEEVIGARNNWTIGLV